MRNRIRPSLVRRNGIKTVSQLFSASRRYFSVIVIFSVVFLGISYILQLTTVSTKGYEIERNEKRLNELKRENQKLQVQLADLSSIENFEKAGGKLNKVESQDISYIVVSTSVAMER